jgi:hypothetical protein
MAFDGFAKHYWLQDFGVQGYINWKNFIRWLGRELGILKIIFAVW